MKHITTVMLGLIIVAGAGQARAGEGAEGTLARDEIRKVVVAHIGEIRRCYNEGLSRDPAAQGRVVLEFTIGAEGTVTRSAVGSSDMADVKVPECMAAAALGWSFPRPEGGEVAVSYPFVLEPG